MSTINSRTAPSDDGFRHQSISSTTPESSLLGKSKSGPLEPPKTEELGDLVAPNWTRSSIDREIRYCLGQLKCGWENEGPLPDALRILPEYAIRPLASLRRITPRADDLNRAEVILSELSPERIEAFYQKAMKRIMAETTLLKDFDEFALTTDLSVGTPVKADNIPISFHRESLIQKLFFNSSELGESNGLTNRIMLSDARPSSREICASLLKLGQLPICMSTLFHELIHTTQIDTDHFRKVRQCFLIALPMEGLAALTIATSFLTSQPIKLMLSTGAAVLAVSGLALLRILKPKEANPPAMWTAIIEAHSYSAETFLRASKIYNNCTIQDFADLGLSYEKSKSFLAKHPEKTGIVMEGIKLISALVNLEVPAKKIGAAIVQERRTAQNDADPLPHLTALLAEERQTRQLTDDKTFKAALALIQHRRHCERALAQAESQRIVCDELLRLG